MSSRLAGWDKLKASLVQDGLLDLYFVEGSEPLPKDLYLEALAGSDVEPLALDNNLRDLAAHADRLVALRRELAELELAAVRAASEYKLFVDTRPLRLEREKLVLGLVQKQTMEAAHREAARAFTIGDPLPSGFHAISVGSSEALAQEQRAGSRQSAILEDVDRLEGAFQDEYWARHTMPGNAHNFAERAKNLSRVAAQEWIFAEARATAVSAGFQLIHARPLPDLPAFGEMETLDKLVLWVRAAIEAHERSISNFVEYDLTIPLVQEAAKGAGPIISVDAFKNAIDATQQGKKPLKLSFRLPPDLFPGKNVRLKRIGLAYGTDIAVLASGIDRTNTFDAYCRYRATMKTPEQVAAGAFPKRFRPPVHLGNVGVYGTSAAYSDGPECENVDPVGDWTIEVHPTPVYKWARNEIWIHNGVDDKPWVDLKLLFRVRAMPA